MGRVASSCVTALKDFFLSNTRSDSKTRDKKCKSTTRDDGHSDAGGSVPSHAQHDALGGGDMIFDLQLTLLDLANNHLNAALVEGGSEEV